MKLYISFLFFLFAQVNSHTTVSLVPLGNAVPCCEQICPAFLPSGNLNDPAVMTASQIAITNDLWNQPFPAASQYSDDIKNLLLQMSISNDPTQQNYAFLATMWIWATVPQIDQNPALCAQAELINTAVNWGNSVTDCNTMIPLLQDLANSVVNLNKFVTATAIKSSGCAQYQLQGSLKTCPGNGLTYNIAGIYSRYGALYPPQLAILNNQLYNSPVYVDRVLGNFLAVSLTPQSQQLLSYFGNSLKAMTFTMIRSPPLTQCCCKKFLRELWRLSRLTAIDANRATIKSLNDIGCVVPDDSSQSSSHSHEQKYYYHHHHHHQQHRQN